MFVFLTDKQWSSSYCADNITSIIKPSILQMKTDDSIDSWIHDAFLLIVTQDINVLLKD